VAIDPPLRKPNQSLSLVHIAEQFLRGVMRLGHTFFPNRAAAKPYLVLLLTKVMNLEGETCGVTTGPCWWASGALQERRGRAPGCRAR